MIAAVRRLLAPAGPPCVGCSGRKAIRLPFRYRVAASYYARKGVRR